MTQRALRVSRGPADRDPMFAATWVGAFEVLPTPHRAEPAPAQTPVSALELPPPSDPDEELAACDILSIVASV